MLADSEVDSRFRMLVASLNSTVQTVDWPEVGEPAENYPGAERRFGHQPREGIGALRVSAVVVALLTMAVGLVVSRAVGADVLFLIAWIAVVVPGVTLAALVVVDRVQRSR